MRDNDDPAPRSAAPATEGAPPDAAALSSSAPERESDRLRVGREVRARYAAELAAADICDSLRIEVRIREEIARELAALAPRSS